MSTPDSNDDVTKLRERLAATESDLTALREARERLTGELMALRRDWQVEMDGRLAIRHACGANENETFPGFVARLTRERDEAQAHLTTLAVDYTTACYDRDEAERQIAEVRSWATMETLASSFDSRGAADAVRRQRKHVLALLPAPGRTGIERTAPWWCDVHRMMQPCPDCESESAPGRTGETPTDKWAEQWDRCQQCRQLLPSDQRPTLRYVEAISEVRCVCGHQHYRHFDSYEDNRPVGCKYCGCMTFVPATGRARDEETTKPTSDGPLSVLDWAQERYDNTIRLADMKTGDDRIGWLTDAAYWKAILIALTERQAETTRGETTICPDCFSTDPTHRQGCIYEEVAALPPASAPAKEK